MTENVINHLLTHILCKVNDYVYLLVLEQHEKWPTATVIQLDLIFNQQVMLNYLEKLYIAVCKLGMGPIVY